MPENLIGARHREALFKKASDLEYWKRLNPQLSITGQGDNVALQSISLDTAVLDQIKERLRVEGYFVLDEILSESVMDRLAEGVTNVWKEGWPEPFVVVYDEYWQLFRSLEPLYTTLFGANYKQVPNFWCWYVDKNNASKGWGLHRDRPAINTVMEDGLPTTITTWIP